MLRPFQTWEDRVAYSTDGHFAYVPHRILVRDAVPGSETLTRLNNFVDDELIGLDTASAVEEAVGYGVIEVTSDTDIPELVDALIAADFDAQPDHVLFADALPASRLYGDSLSGDPLWGNGLAGDPLWGNPLAGNPLWGNPYLEGLLHGNLFAELVALDYPLPTPSLAGPHGREYARSGRGRSGARPVDYHWDGQLKNRVGGNAVVTILDVPLPSGPLPQILDNTMAPLPGLGVAGVPAPGDPDRDVDGFLDRVAGHGLFIAGVVAQTYPACQARVIDAMSNLGDVPESEVAKQISALAGETEILSLSFSGYAMHHMGCLAKAVRRFQHGPRRSEHPRLTGGGVVVCSAGNDGSWVAPYPAALPRVISVAALGPDGPAPFTNRGPWVRACAAGVDVESTFFNWANGTEPRNPVEDPDLFTGRARWSGTSFATPLVAARLAKLVVNEGLAPKEAVPVLLSAPGLAGLPWLGTIVTA
ncbi:MAG TPA: S8/S53 family peptidase [Mycobacteriales bacterium]|nr:S8/S53 family peptidase [Mycobacteriales bacterium]